MQEYIVKNSLDLERGSMLRIEDGRDILVYVWEGEIWLTEHCERRDRLMRAGDWYRLERQGAAIGQAIERSVVMLTAPEPEQFARRIVLIKAGGAARVELYNAARDRKGSLAARLRRLWFGLYAPQSRPTSAGL
jgi:hypothetical protein